MNTYSDFWTHGPASGATPSAVVSTSPSSGVNKEGPLDEPLVMALPSGSENIPRDVMCLCVDGCGAVVQAMHRVQTHPQTTVLYNLRVCITRAEVGGRTLIVDCMKFHEKLSETPPKSADLRGTITCSGR